MRFGHVYMWTSTFEPAHPTYEHCPTPDSLSSGYSRCAHPSGNKGTSHRGPNEVLQGHLPLDLCATRLQSLTMVGAIDGQSLQVPMQKGEGLVPVPGGTSPR